MLEREGHSLSLEIVALPSRADLTEGHWEEESDFTLCALLSCWIIFSVLPLVASPRPVFSHLCPPADTFHSYGPRLCPRYSSTCPAWCGLAEGARSLCSPTLSGSTEPAQVGTLTQDKAALRLEADAKTQGGFLLTGASISIQHVATVAGTFVAAKCVETVPILTNALQGALVDVCRGAKMKRFCSYTVKG